MEGGWGVVLGKLGMRWEEEDRYYRYHPSRDGMGIGKVELRVLLLRKAKARKLLDGPEVTLRRRSSFRHNFDFHRRRPKGSERVGNVLLTSLSQG